MRSFLNEFKEFAMRGSVIDLAIGIIIGVAFNDVVKSLVNDVIMPPIGLLLNNVNFADLYINLNDKSYPSMAAAQEAGAATINYGLFLNTVINFVIVALVVFMLVKQINRLKPAEEAPAAPATKECPFCRTSIPVEATRCPACTSHLDETASPA